MKIKTATITRTPSKTVRHILKAYEPRIAVYGAALHQQEPDVAVAVGKDGYLKVSSLKIPETQLTCPLPSRVVLITLII